MAGCNAIRPILIIKHHIIPQNKLSRTPQIFYTLMAKDLVKNQIALAPAELINQNNEPVPL